MKRLIIPVFIPNLGCPHRCLFCDQRPITGAPQALPTEAEVARAAAPYLASKRARRGGPRQLAFYGGTFTLLPEADQEYLLAIGRGYLARGEVDSLRLSTRPDAVDARCLARLAGSGVRTVELGAQSFDEGVLGLARRGHTAAQTREAARLIRAAGLELGLQLMCGLPGETRESFAASCRAAAALGPELVRLYPVLVLEGTGLARLWRQGGYRPLSLEEAAAWCAEALAIFEAAAVPVARAGLPPSAGLEAALLAGPYHPAFGQLVRSAAWRERLRGRLAPLAGSPVRLEVAAADLSDLLGQRGESLRALAAELGLAALSATASTRLPRGGVRILEG